MTWNTLFSAFCWGMPIYREESVLSSSGTVFRSWGWTSSWIPPYSRALAVNRWWTSSGGVMIPLGEVYWCGKINHSEIGSVKSSQAKSKAAFLWFSISACFGTWFNILKPLITMDLCQPKMVSLPREICEKGWILPWDTAREETQWTYYFLMLINYCKD